MPAAVADLAGLRVGAGAPARVMGVVNVSPESFYGGSVARTRERTLERARAMVEGGSDVIDVGAMSTAPYLKTAVSQEEEMERLGLALRALKEVGGLRISVDTSRSRVAEFALGMGASIVNDVTGLRGDRRMARVVGEHGASLVVMARGGEEKGTARDPVARVGKALRASLELAAAAGIRERSIVVDPGIGFFREKGGGAGYSPQNVAPWYVWDCLVLKGLGRLKRALRRPVLVSVSRKSFIGRILDVEDPDERLPGSLGATVVAVINGADMVRTHDVKETVQAVRVAEAIAKASLR